MEYDFFVHLCAINKIFAYGTAHGRRLLDKFEDISEIFALKRKDLEEMMPHGEAFIDQIINPDTLEWARREVDWASEYGIRLLSMKDKAYPFRLLECDDAPLMLYCKGEADLNAERVLAVVGTRRATYYGQTTCRRIIEKMSTNEVKPLVVSGMALGIDGVAHNAALEFGLQTVGVLPTGLDEIYPPRHRDLAKRVIEQGALVTDFPRATAAFRHTFLRRNRIIAGMADAVLLAESYVPGGGLITASLASSYNREVFAVPGRITDASFAGCNKLIRENAAAIVDADDTVEKAMNWCPPRKRRKRDPLLFKADDSESKRKILRTIREKSPVTADDILTETGLEFGRLSSDLLELEIEGRVFSDRHFYYLCNR